MYVVARTYAAVIVDHEFRHDEQRYALHPFRRSGRARQHQMDDVLGVILLAIGDEDLLAVELVSTVSLRDGASAHGGKIGPCLRLGQIHRAGPHALHHLRHELRLLHIRTDQLDRLDRALGQQRAQGKRKIGAVPHLFYRGRHQLRQALSTKIRILGEPIPAVGDELRVGILKTGRRLDRAAFGEARALSIADGVQRIEHLAGKLRGLLQYRFDGIGGRFFIARKLADLLEPRQLVEHEADVVERCVVCAHGVEAD